LLKRLVIVGGPPFTGKAAFGQALARALAAPIVKWTSTRRCGAGEARLRGFADEIRRALAARDIVVAVAPLPRREQRQKLLELGARADARLCYVECVAEPEEVAERAQQQFASAAPDFLELRRARARGMLAGYEPVEQEIAPAPLLRVALSRPIADTLAEVVAAVGPPAPAPTQPAPGRAAARATVVIIDDDGDVRETLGEMMTTLGCRVSMAACGSEALALSRARESAPDLVLLDYALPDTSGLDLLPQLRQAWPAAEIVLLTAYDAPWMCDQAFRERADEYLRKPIRAVDLITLVSRVAE
jgi:CheY-like chemotaxis protein